jgi:hypothetical protein
VWRDHSLRIRHLRLQLMTVMNNLRAALQNQLEDSRNFIVICVQTASAAAAAVGKKPSTKSEAPMVPQVKSEAPMVPQVKAKGKAKSLEAEPTAAPVAARATRSTKAARA